jgi:hypothetical protein
VDVAKLSPQEVLSLLREILDSDQFSLPAKLQRFQKAVWDDGIVGASDGQLDPPAARP